MKKEQGLLRLCDIVTSFLCRRSKTNFPRQIGNTVKPVLSGHPRDPCYCPLYRGVRLIQVRFTENKGRKIGLYRGWCPLNAGCLLNMGSA